MEKFPRQVSISGLVPLSLAYGSGLHNSILKDPQRGNIVKQIESTFNCESPLFDHKQQKNTAVFNFPDYNTV